MYPPPINNSVFHRRRLRSTITNDEFDSIYPDAIRELSAVHWTPVDVARRAASWLVTESGARVLDIGSGSGKFCLVGAGTTPGYFVGVEQRENLVHLSRELAQQHELENCEFLHANIKDIDCSGYDAFYLYNPFEENVWPFSARIDHSVRPSRQLHIEYLDYVRDQLSQRPAGTRVVTYWGKCLSKQVGYQLQAEECDGLLKFWVKQGDVASPGRMRKRGKLRSAA